MDWTREEVELIVADYLHMLTLELAGQTYNKSEHRRALKVRLGERSDAAVEKKHQNISAVMIGLGCPYISGYKPLMRYQAILRDVVLAQLDHDQQFDETARRATELPAAAPLVESALGIFVPAPEKSNRVEEQRKPYVSSTTGGIRRDYLDREARNRSLGSAGELYVVALERARLHQSGQKKLVDRVEHASALRGDGLGYDVLSFDAAGNEIFIEVKTTAFGIETPFFISKNEVEFSNAYPKEFHLYRAFNFRSGPRVFDLTGPVEQSCHLDAMTFMGTFS